MIKRRNIMMHKLIWVLSIFSILSLVFILPGGEGAALAMPDCDPAYVTSAGIEITVKPTGLNDTINLQCAFDAAVAAGSGRTVRLMQGTYYIENDIAVENFDGYFVGAGKHATFIQNLNDVPFPHHDELGGVYVFENWPGLFVFYQNENGWPSSISISDLTFRALGQAVPFKTHGGFVGNSMNILEIYGKFTDIRDDEVSFVDTSLIRVGFEGQGGSDFTYGYNVLNAAQIAGSGFSEPCGDSTCIDYIKPVSGNHLVLDCTFENTMWGYAAVMMIDSNVEVESSTFTNVKWPIDVLDVSNSTINIKQNTIHNANFFGVSIENGYQAVLGWDLGPHGDIPAPSSAIISNNEISVSEIGDGIGIIDYGNLIGESTYGNVTVRGNKIHLNGTTYGAIVGQGVSGLAITNNLVTGIGALGIYAGLWDDPVANWVLVGNNLQTANTEWPPIILGPSTSNFIVVGGSNKTGVLDLGTDNILVGVNNMGTGVGPTISNLMKRMK
jgi:hypothetical protein